MGQCYNSIVVHASAERVWATVRDFHDLSWAGDVITRADKVGDAAGDVTGARRILNEAIHETLLELRDADRLVRYSIDDGPGPLAKDAVKNYRGCLQVFPVTSDDTSYVLWTSTYDSPNDPAVAELCNPVYQALLGALKTHCESA